MHRYEGTINQFLGDGFMALFGAPIAHEDHARRAVLAALGVAARAQVKVRIGINSGLVVVGAIGDDLRVDYTAFGDTTVLAARLQAAAAPGAVLVSQQTARLVRGYFQLENVAPVQVKERTVDPLRVIGLGTRTARIASSDEMSPFTGRVPIDARRLRPNLVVRSGQPFIEESWLGRLIRIGTGQDEVHAVFDRVIERCVMVGMRQPGLSASGTVLKRIAQRESNPLRLAIGGAITRPGTVRVGAPVRPAALTDRT